MGDTNQVSSGNADIVAQALRAVEQAEVNYNRTGYEVRNLELKVKGENDEALAASAQLPQAVERNTAAQNRLKEAQNRLAEVTGGLKPHRAPQSKKSSASPQVPVKPVLQETEKAGQILDESSLRKAIDKLLKSQKVNSERINFEQMNFERMVPASHTRTRLLDDGASVEKLKAILKSPLAEKK